LENTEDFDIKIIVKIETIDEIKLIFFILKYIINTYVFFLRIHNCIDTNL